MSKLIETNYKNLGTREERAVARLALIARNDVYFERAKALILNRRLKLSPNADDFESAVNDAYCSNNGVARNFTAYKCPECGSACLGQDKAMDCCAQQEVWAEVCEEGEGITLTNLATVGSDEVYDLSDKE